MILRRSFIAKLAFAGAFVAGFGLLAPAIAGDVKPFDWAAFDAAKAAGKPILVEVTAPWCPTCKVQRPILAELRAQPKFKDLVTFEVNFDTAKDILRKLNVQMQSTLITFRGVKEVGRSTGDTNRGSIEKLLEAAI